MTTADALLRDIVEHPDDDTPRLVYADWLDEHGDPARAELIRVQCEMARLPQDDPRVKELGRQAEQLLDGEVEDDYLEIDVDCDQP